MEAAMDDAGFVDSQQPPSYYYMPTNSSHQLKTFSTTDSSTLQPIEPVSSGSVVSVTSTTQFIPPVVTASHNNAKQSSALNWKEEESGFGEDLKLFILSFFLYFRDFFQQTVILLQKNFLLYIRRWKSTLIQLVAPIFIISICWILVLIVQSVRNDYVTPFPGAVQTRQLVPCRSWGGVTCYTIAYAHNNNDFAKRVMGSMAEQVGLNATDFLEFQYEADMKDFFFRNPNTTLTGLAFSNNTSPPQGPQRTFYPQANLTSYTIYYNATGDVRPQVREVQTLVDANIIYLTAKESGEAVEFNRSSIQVKWKGYPRPSATANGQVFIFATTGPQFFSMIGMFVMVLALNAIAVEKETRIRFGMKVIGLKDSSYWFSWFLTLGVVSALQTLITIAFGSATQIFIFLNTDFVPIFSLFFVYCLSLVSMAFLLSTFVNTGKSALILGFIVLALGFILNTIISNPTLIFQLYDPNTPVILPILFSVYPPYNFAKMLADITSLTQPVLNPITRVYEGGQRYTFNQMYKWTTQNNISVPPSVHSLWILMANGVFFLIVHYYLDKVLPQESGISRNPFFFLFPSYWGIHFRKRVKINKDAYPLPPQLYDALDDDVRDEYHRARDDTKRFGLRIVGLRKRFYKIFSVFNAVSALDLTVEHGTCLAILGHNGAGKSTTINILTGLLSPSYGDAIIYGKSVKHRMADIRREIGYCPQHDILMSDLTAFEHLYLFALLKNTPTNRLMKEIEDRLRGVALWDVRHKQVGGFSGGMKRRLSVAIACIGNPKLIILDEPTSGMDSYTRRSVWALIQSLKGDRIIMLTTHSMEEADYLSDRIAIMAKGKLKCVGNSLHLKAKYGAGYSITLVANPGCVSAVKQLANDFLPNGKLISEDAGNLVFNIAPEFNGELIGLLERVETILQDTSKPSILKDWGISHTTLEEVYLRVTAEGEFGFSKFEEEEERVEEEVKKEEAEDEKPKQEIGVLTVQYIEPTDQYNPSTTMPNNSVVQQSFQEMPSVNSQMELLATENDQ